MYFTNVSQHYQSFDPVCFVLHFDLYALAAWNPEVELQAAKQAQIELPRLPLKSSWRTDCMSIQFFFASLEEEIA